MNKKISPINIFIIKMKNVTRVLKVLGAIFLLHGCVVTSQQAEGIRNLLTQSKIDVSAASWELQYADYKSIVYAVRSDRGTVFLNDLGDFILFDGWSIRAVKGLGKYQLDFAITDHGDERTFTANGLELSDHRCDSWQKETAFKKTLFYQPCAGSNQYINRILLDANQNIVLIRQIVDRRYTAVLLSKL